MAFDGIGLWDYVSLCVVSFVASIPGLYLMRRSKNAESSLDFLVSGKGLGLLHIILSMSATSIAGLTFIGLPADTYRYGIAMIGLSVGGMLAIPLVSHLYLPVLLNTKGISVYEYIERRFNNTTRQIMSSLNVLFMTMMASIAIYAPSLVLNYALNINIWYCIASMSIVCTTYTSLGGFRAVVWTDGVQMMVVVTVFVTVLTKGCIDLGGITNIWTLNSRGNRTKLYITKQPYHSELTLWPVLFGTMFMVLTEYISQAQVQRCWAAGTLSKARRSLYLSQALTLTTKAGFVLIGFIIFAKYHDCDPYSSGKINARDQEVVLLISELFSSVQGFLGVFLAGLLCGAISTYSSIINSTVCFVMGDFVEPLFPHMTKTKLLSIAKIIGIILGLSSTALIMLLQQVPELLSAFFIVVGLLTGPHFGMFTLGMLSPWTGVLPAAIGSLASILFIGWAAIGRLLAKPILMTAPISTAGCNFSMELSVSNITNTPERDIFPLYTFHSFWYPCWSALITVFVGLLTTLLLGPQNPENVDSKLLFPCVVTLIGRLPIKLRRRLGFTSAHAKSHEVTLQVQDSNTNTADVAHSICLIFLNI